MDKIEQALEQRGLPVRTEFEPGSWPDYLTRCVWQEPRGKYVFRGKRYKRHGQAAKAAWIRYCAITKGQATA